ncbi:hypothetical protein IK7_05786 [Bacillus cereus VD156]|nr:hypothetical protein IK7_05786 [Bacillus cereus VD156]KLA23282.1 hypothetical protein B4080_2017 [Bacillus cereus]
MQIKVVFIDYTLKKSDIMEEIVLRSGVRRSFLVDITH